MNNRLFDRIVELLSESMDHETALALVEQQCRLLGIEPCDLRPRDGGKLITKMMANLSYIIPHESWKSFDPNSIPVIV